MPAGDDSQQQLRHKHRPIKMDPEYNFKEVKEITAQGLAQMAEMDIAAGIWSFERAHNQ